MLDKAVTEEEEEAALLFVELGDVEDGDEAETACDASFVAGGGLFFGFGGPFALSTPIQGLGFRCLIVNLPAFGPCFLLLPEARLSCFFRTVA